MHAWRPDEAPPPCPWTRNDAGLGQLYEPLDYLRVSASSEVRPLQLVSSSSRPARVSRLAPPPGIQFGSNSEGSGTYRVSRHMVLVEAGAGVEL